MDEVAPADFYTGIVVDVYGLLRGSVPDPALYAAFIGASGEPALELGCGDGDPLLALRAAGIDVEGLDSSGEMLVKLERSAAQLGLEVTLHHSTIQTMDLGKTYRSIFLAGPTFNLLPDDATASRALERVRAHLDVEGAALIPLFVPEPVPEGHLGVAREHVDEIGRTLRVTATASSRDEAARTQVTDLLYEIADAQGSESVERPWLLHWYSQERFHELAVGAGLRVEAILAADGSDAAPDADQFSFWLRRDDAPAD